MMDINLLGWILKMASHSKEPPVLQLGSIATGTHAAMPQVA